MSRVNLLDDRDDERDSLVTINHEGVRAETDMAKLFALSADEGVWIPKSQIDYDDDEVFVIPRWLARENDLEEGWSDG